MAIENTSYVASTFSDVRSLENLRAAGLIRQTAEEAEDLTDVVQLSEESVALAREENLQVRRESVTNVAENEGDTNFYFEENVARSNPLMDLLTSINREATEEPGSVGAITTNQPGEPLTANLEGNQTPTATEPRPSPAVESTAEGTVEPRPVNPRTPPPTPEQETGITLEEQATDLQRLNSILNSANGVPSETPPNATEQAGETRQYNQQVLLQNVTTQLAQTVPPANVVSVLG